MIRKQTHQRRKTSVMPMTWTVYVYDDMNNVVFNKIYYFESNALSMVRKWKIKFEKELLDGYTVGLREDCGCWCSCDNKVPKDESGE